MLADKLIAKHWKFLQGAMYASHEVNITSNKIEYRGLWHPYNWHICSSFIVPHEVHFILQIWTCPWAGECTCYSTGQFWQCCHLGLYSIVC